MVAVRYWVDVRHSVRLFSWKKRIEITEISIAYHLIKHSQCLEEIIFETKHGIKKGFKT